MPDIISIDIGTRFIKAAFFDKNSFPNRNFEDIYRIKTVNWQQANPKRRSRVEISYDAQKDCHVFRLSEFSSDIFGNYCTDEIKSMLNKENSAVFYPFRRQANITSYEILVNIFIQLKREICGQNEKNPVDTILTVPVSFSEYQKNKMKKAAAAAGLNVTDILTEPFGALIYQWEYLKENYDSNPCDTMVLDIGGGTSDLSLYRISFSGSELKISTLASDCIMFGGNDIDRAIYGSIMKDSRNAAKFREYVENAIKSQFNDVSGKVYSHLYDYMAKVTERETMERIMRLKEDVSLSTLHDCSCFEFIDFLAENISMSYNELAELLDLSGIKNVFECVIEEMLDISGCETGNVRKFMIMGGTSNIKYFEDMIADIFGISQEQRQDFFIHYDTNSYELYTAVAQGALIYRVMNGKPITICSEDISRVSYEAGVIENGVYRCIVSKQNLFSASVPERYITVYPERNQKTGEWRVCLYKQLSNTCTGTFFEDMEKNEKNNILVRNAVYMGYFPIREDVISDGNSVKMKFRFGYGGKISAVVFDPFSDTEYEKWTDIIAEV